MRNLSVALFTCFISSVSSSAIAQNAGNTGNGAVSGSNGLASLSVVEINRLKEKVLIFMDDISWDIDFYDSDYFDCKNNSELRKKVSDFLNLNPEDIVMVRYLKDDDAIKVWGSRGKYGVLEVRTNKNNFVSQIGRRNVEMAWISLAIKDPDDFLFIGYDIARYDVPLVTITGNRFHINMAPKMRLRG